jgi:hypothetical protein
MRLLAKQVPSLSSHIPNEKAALRRSAAPCRPGAAPGLGGFGDLPVLAGTRHICGIKWCGQPVTLRLLSIGNAVS